MSGPFYPITVKDLRDAIAELPDDMRVGIHDHEASGAFEPRCEIVDDWDPPILWIASDSTRVE